MKVAREALLLRIFIGEADDCQGQPLFRTIVLKAREQHLAGATVFRGPLGFGRSSHMHQTRALRLSFDHPIVIEIVDEESKIRDFLQQIEKLVGSGLITLERVRAVFYRPDNLTKA
jgi:PII-like signaling protein